MAQKNIQSTYTRITIIQESHQDICVHCSLAAYRPLVIFQTHLPIVKARSRKERLTKWTVQSQYAAPFAHLGSYGIIWTPLDPLCTSRDLCCPNTSTSVIFYSEGNLPGKTHVTIARMVTIRTFLGQLVLWADLYLSVHLTSRIHLGYLVFFGEPEGSLSLCETRQ